MTRLMLLCVALFLFLSGSRVFAQIQSPPTTAPVPPGVVIYPFSPVGDPGRFNWVGHGIQQSLMVDASRRGTSLLNTPAESPAGGQADPVGAATKAGASVVVIGSYQIVNDQIRVTGQTIQTSNGQVLGILSATGAVTNLFRIEDVLGDQLRHALPGTVPDNEAAVTTGTTTATSAAALSGPAEVYQPETNGGYVYAPPVDVSPVPSYSYAGTTYVAPEPSYYYPTYDPYSYYYGGYPYYGSYWGWGGGFVIINNGRGFHHDRDDFRGHDRDDFRGGRDRNGFHDFGHGDFGIRRGGGFNRGSAMSNIGAPRSSFNGFGAGRNQSFSPGGRAFGGGMGGGGGFHGGGGGHR